MGDLDFLKKQIGKNEPTLCDVIERCFNFLDRNFYIGNRKDYYKFSITYFGETAYWDLSKNLLSEQSEETIKILAKQFSI